MSSSRRDGRRPARPPLAPHDEDTAAETRELVAFVLGLAAGAIGSIVAFVYAIGLISDADGYESFDALVGGLALAACAGPLTCVFVAAFLIVAPLIFTRAAG